MNITTENIDEWCFRYLERDLDEEECSFFENQLLNNPLLKNQLSLWQKTILNSEPAAPADQIIANNLFRYKTQVLYAAVEFVFVSALVVFLLCTYQKKSAPVDSAFVNAVDSTFAIKAPVIQIHKDSLFFENMLPVKHTGTNLLPEYTKDSISILHNDETVLSESDTIAPNSNIVQPIPEKLNQIDSIKIVSDTTESHKKIIQKKNSPKHRYKGSRLIPINNDL